MNMQVSPAFAAPGRRRCVQCGVSGTACECAGLEFPNELVGETGRARKLKRRPRPSFRPPVPVGPAPSGVFVAVPVENPGGGRIRDKRAPAPADVVTVTGVGGRSVPLQRLAAAAWRALVAAAAADGIAAPLLLPVSGFRSPKHQEELWRRALARYGSAAEARKWVAPPGNSPHQTGRAIDFYLGGKNSSANVANLRRTRAYQWLLKNALRFGFYPYSAEPWHWEYNPSAGGAAPVPPAPTPPAPKPAPSNVVRCPAPANLDVPQRTALALTSNFETGTPFGCVVSRPADPDGISMGMIQWNLRAKTLQALLRSFEREGGSLARYFNDLLPELRRLLAMPQASGAEVEAMIAEARRLRLASPGRWETALLSLCSDPIFCRLQVNDLRRRFATSWPAVQRLGLRTIRGLCMLFDIQVGDGYAAKVNGRVVANGKVDRFAARLEQRKSQLGRALSEREKLVEIADEASRFAGKWAAERRARRLVIANGTGLYRGSQWNLAPKFPNLNDPLPPGRST